MFERIKSLFAKPKLEVSKKRPSGIPGINILSEQRFPIVGREGGISPQTPIEDFIDLYEAHTWVFKCVKSISESAANAPWAVWKLEEPEDADVSNQTAVWKKTDGTDILTEILKAPNPFQGGLDLFTQTFMDLELTGSAYWEKARNPKDGNVIALFHIHPNRIMPIPDGKKYIRGWKFFPDEENSEGIVLPPEDVIEFKYPSPRDDYFGTSPLSPLTPDITADFNAIMYNKNFFGNNATPDFVLETDQMLPKQLVDRIRREWSKRHQGVSNAHRTAILHGGLKVKQVAFNQKDMQFIETRKLTRETILSAFGVPPIIVGLVESANYSNSLEQKQTFWRETMIPKLKIFQETIFRTLAPDHLDFRWSMDEIEDLIEDKSAKATIEQRDVQAGILTINEVRASRGLKPVPWGDVWHAPINVAAVDEEGNQTSLPPSAGGPSLPEIDEENGNFTMPSAPRTRKPGDEMRTRSFNGGNGRF